jgi:hypothetical protein
MRTAAEVQKLGRRIADTADLVDENSSRVETFTRVADAILPEGPEFGGLRKKLLGTAIAGALAGIDRFTNIADSVSDLSEIPDVFARTAAAMAAILRQDLAGREVGGTLIARAIAFTRIYRAMGSAPTVNWEDIAELFRNPPAPAPAPEPPTPTPTDIPPAPVTTTPSPAAADTLTPLPEEARDFVNALAAGIRTRSPLNRADAMRMIAETASIPPELREYVLEALNLPESVAGRVAGEDTLDQALQNAEMFRDELAGKTRKEASAYLSRLGGLRPNLREQILNTLYTPEAAPAAPRFNRQTIVETIREVLKDGSITWADGMQLLESFTGIPLRERFGILREAGLTPPLAA